MFFSWISLDLDLRSQVISWSLLVPSCSIIFTYKKLTPPTIASGITIESVTPQIGTFKVCSYQRIARASKGVSTPGSGTGRGP